MLRVCKTCCLEKPLNEFTKNSRCNYGVTNKCLKCSAEYSLKYYYDNTELRAEAQKKSVAKRKSKGKDVNKAQREWARRNPHSKRFHAAQRKTHVKQATPPWLTDSQKSHIKRTYKLAQIIKDATGVDYHVDHIVPLRGKNICGLHIPENLRVLRADLNLSKSNIYK